MYKHALIHILIGLLLVTCFNTASFAKTHKKTEISKKHQTTKRTKKHKRHRKHKQHRTSKKAQVNQKHQVTKKAQVTDKNQEQSPFEWKITLDLPAHYTDNAFYTPSDTFVNPETGNLSKATASSGMVITPKIVLKAEYSLSKLLVFGTKNKFEQDKHLQSDFLSGLDGNNRKNSFYYRGDTWGHKWQVGLLNSKNNYKYLHRGSGKLRISKTLQSDISDRYKYNSKGNYLLYSYLFPGAYKLELGYKKVSKSYSEFPTYSSLDRDETTNKLILSKKWSKRFKVILLYKTLNSDYLTAYAYGLDGRRTRGVAQKFKDTTTKLSVHIGPKSFRWSPSFTSYKSKDLYVDYWSFAEQKAQIALQYKLHRKLYLKTDLTNRTRKYDKEPNPFGKIRTQTEQVIGAKLNYSLSKKQGVYLEYKQQKQRDDDNYYSFNRNETTLNYTHKF